jgi:LysR family hydrogen peroxide-inducible transcriptional activator
MDNLTLKQFRYFEALAQHGHFGRAADACAISQPALSVQIKDLEKTLGAPLFERGARDVRLTQFGQVFAHRVRDILQSVADLGDLARAAQNGLAGHVRIGAIPTLAPYILPRLIGRLTQTYPGIDIQIRETLTEHLLDALAHNAIDAALLALPLPQTGLTIRPVFEEDLIFVRPADQAKMPAPTARDLQDMPLLLLEKGHCLRDQTLDYCNLPPGAKRNRLDGSSLATLVQMVGAGLGVTIIPALAQRVETQSKAVCTCRFDGAQPKRTIVMAWRKTTPFATEMGHMAALIRSIAAQLGAKPIE